ncbi:MAG: ABC transporter permease [Firmicutes bacterium]|nr:ABC transporter permease [Bacillota bacterium]
MVKKIITWAYTVLIFCFLYAPIAVLMAMSFNESQYNALPFKFSTKWYALLAENTKLIDATVHSLYIAAITGAICVILGTALMLGVIEVRPKIKALINSLVVLPLTIPWLIMGLSLLLLLRALGLERNFVILLIGHVIISLPYAVLVIAARMQDMDRSIQEASYSLGANDWVTFVRITLPIIFPAMLSGGFIAFMISFDNFVISYFLIPTGNTTLPIEIYSSIKFGFTPEINAISTIMLSISLIIILFIAGSMRSSIKSLFK